MPSKLDTYPQRLVTKGFYKIVRSQINRGLFEYKLNLTDTTKEMVVVDLTSFFSKLCNSPAITWVGDLSNKIIRVTNTTESEYTRSEVVIPYMAADWEFVDKVKYNELMNEPNLNQTTEVESLSIQALNAMKFSIYDKIKADPRNHLPTGEIFQDDESVDDYNAIDE